MAKQPKFTQSASYQCLENLKNQTNDLYLRYCGYEICPHGHSYGPNERAEYLLHYVLSGKGVFRADGRDYVLGAHDAFLIYPNETIYYRADPEDPWVYLWVAFRGVIAEDSLRYAGLSRDSRVGTYHKEPAYCQYVYQMLEARQLTYANDLLRSSYLLQFLSTMVQEHQAARQSAPELDYSGQTYADHAANFIELHYAENIHISDIASYIGIDRSYLAHSFRQSRGMSPQEYLLSCRMNRASVLLRTTDEPIGNIAAMVGYGDPLAFSKAFKRAKDLSPKAFREAPSTPVRSARKGQ